MPRRILIFAPYGAWMVHHQLDAVIGAALSHRGCEVMVATCDGFLESCFIAGKPPNPGTCRSCALTGQGVFARLGLKVVQIRGLLDDEDRAEAAAFARTADPARLDEVRYRNHPLGRWCPPSMQSYFSTASFRLDQEWVVKAIRDQFSNGVLLCRALGRLMDDFKPDQVFSYNSTHFYYRIAFELAKERGIPVLVHERGHLNDSFTLLDGESTNANQGRFDAFRAWEDVPLTAEECEETRTYFREREEGKNGFSRFYAFETPADDVRRALRIPPDATLLALFGSGDRELGAFETVQRKTFSGQIEWIRATAEICRKRGWYLVIRHHPSNVIKNQVNFPFIGELQSLNRELPDCVRVVMPHEKLTSYAVLWNADGAVTHFSTMGSETPTRGVVGVCVGDSLYQPLGVEWAGAPDRYEDALAASVAKTRDFGLENLRRAYRGAHYVVFKLGYKFKSFGIRDVYGPDIRVQSPADLGPGRDPILDRVCDYAMEGKPLLPVPSAQDKARSDADEKAFLERELRGVREKRQAIKAAARTGTAPEGPILSVICPGGRRPNPIRDKSLARSREKRVERIDSGADPSGDYGSFLDGLAAAASKARGRYAYVALPGVDVDESVFSSSIDVLERPENGEMSGVVWGAWVASPDGKLAAEIFTDAKPAGTFEEALSAFPQLAEPPRFFPFFVMRKEFLVDLAGWLDALAGFGPMENAASFYNLLYGPKSEGSMMRMAVPMISLYADAPSSNAPADASALTLADKAAGTEPDRAREESPRPHNPAILERSPDELRAELESKARMFSANPGDAEAGIACADLLTRLGEGHGARRVLTALQQRNPSDPRFRPLLDAVEWKSRQGSAAVFEWNLRGAAYERLHTKTALDSWEEARPYVDSVPGWMLQGQEQFLFEKVKSLPDGALILEMGADRGRSTSAMALACKGTRKRIISIDTFAGNDGIMGKTYDFLHEWRGNLARLGVDRYATARQGYTFDVLPAWDLPVDFVFIDASHEYIDVLNDLKLIYPFVKKGGWIAFHDVEPGWPGPWRVWLEYGIPLLTHHQVVATLTCGRKSEEYPFGKKPEAAVRFSFARSWIEDLRASGDPQAASLLPALAASLDFGSAGEDARRRAFEAEKAIAGMAPHLRQTLFNMISKDAFLDGYLHYWYGLALETEGKVEEARREYGLASTVSYSVPPGQLGRRPAPIPAERYAPADPFRPHVASGATVLQAGCGDGRLLAALPGRLKLGLETDDAKRKQASLTHGIDAYNRPSEFPDGFADVVLGDSLASEEQPLELLKALRAKLKPSGKAVFVAPAPETEAVGALYAWTPGALSNLFTKAGFLVRESGYLDGVPRTVRVVAGIAPAEAGEPGDVGGSTARQTDWAAVKAPFSVARDPGRTDPRDIPVALVAYRRPEHTRRVLESLERHGIRKLFLFCDAAKGNGDERDVESVRRLAEGIGWTRAEVYRAESNRGLAKSVMSAVDHVLERHGTVALLEDDCVPHAHFFRFLSDGLDRYRENEKVFGISGYTVPMPPEILRRYPFDAYFSPRISSWGWATWKRAWQSFDRDLLSVCRKALDARIDFDQGGNDIKVNLEGMLQGRVKDVWTLPWVLSVYLRGGCFLYPTVSHLDNIGMDGTGVHCGSTDKYRTTLADSPALRFPEGVFYDAEVIARFRSFYDLSLQGA